MDFLKVFPDFNCISDIAPPMLVKNLMRPIFGPIMVRDVSTKT